MSRTVAFVCINGTGMGHATRILAIARRLPPDITPVIISNSPALDAFEILPGAIVEHVPGFEYLDISRRAWTSQLHHEFDALLKLYGCEVVVQDGTAIFPWVLENITGSDIARKLVWIRRPMWRDRQAVYKNLQDQAWCDLVIEPGELAGELDQGPTTRALELAPPPLKFIQTAPIRLLDQAEQLQAGKARAALGMVEGERAALVQLGAGSLRRNWDAADAAIQALRTLGTHRIFLARWKISGAQPDYGRDVTVLDTYPLARFFRAFDFHIAAAGYNSFHEIMATGQRAVFVPNHMEVDDQFLRASFAATGGWGEVLDARPAESLHARMKDAVTRIARAQPLFPESFLANGAERAAQEIAALCGS
jgi:UDP-N-acetylglucosamine--N-acetylmuramyl-(pentapeptide) pyrophosphoryl-undecaprenol N-acetylglucosamine transferase